MSSALALSMLLAAAAAAEPAAPDLSALPSVESFRDALDAARRQLRADAEPLARDVAERLLGRRLS
jgi:hypothetical protein